MNIKLTPSEILEYLFCPRFFYYMNVLKIPQYEERRYKVIKGREVHERRRKENRGYLWKKMGVISRESDVVLSSQSLGLWGIVDEVVQLEDGTWAPVDYKWAIYPEYVYVSHRTQLLAYCAMVEETYNVVVNKGFLIYVREGRRQVEIAFGEAQRAKLATVINEMVSLVTSERLAPPTSGRVRCRDCTYKNICIPVAF